MGINFFVFATMEIRILETSQLLTGMNRHSAFVKINPNDALNTFSEKLNAYNEKLFNFLQKKTDKKVMYYQGHVQENKTK